MSVDLQNDINSQSVTQPLNRKIYRLGLLIFILLFVGYIIVWSIISLDRFYSLHAGVLDLGINMYRGWVLYHNNWNLKTYLGYFAMSPFVFIFSPIMLLESYPLILIIQTIVLALPGIFLYMISRELKINPLYSAIIASLYLMYFPLAGINYTDFHYQSFFILFFVAGYFFQLRKKLMVSFIFFALASMVRFPYVAFVLIYAVVGLLVGRTDKSKVTDNSLLKFYFALAFFSVILLFFSYMTSYSSPQLVSSDLNGVSGGSVLIPKRVGLSLFTYFVILSPFLFSPLKQAKWLLLLLPSFLLTILSNYQGYLFLYYLNSQYGSSYVPFVLISYVELISSIENRKFSRHENRDQQFFFRKTQVHCNLVKYIKKSVTSKRILIVSLVLLFAMNLYFQPLGPLNGHDNAGFYIYTNTGDFNPNLSQYYGLLDAIALINEKDYNNTLIQDNMPEFLPRTVSSPGILVTATGIFNGSISNQSIATNRFPVYFSNGWHNVSIDYVIAQPGNYFFYIGKPSVSQYYTALLSSGYYGILADFNGTVVLERGYKGPTIKLGV